MKNFPSEKKIVDEFFKWVKIDSPSGKEERISAEIIKRLKKQGIKTEKDETGNIKAFVPASKGFEKKSCVYLAAHIDTVQPGENVKPVLKNGKITSSSDTVLGADDKDGLTAILLAVEYVLKEKLPHPALELIFTVMEEKGTAGSAKIKKGWIKSKYGWVFDGPGKIGTIYKGAVGAAEFEVEITGRAAHAGSCPEKGINALKAAANAISRIEIGRISPNHTVNIGVLNSGVARNIVPEKAYLHGETRSNDMKTVKKSLAEIKKVFKEETAKAGAKINFREHIAYYPFSLPSDSVFIKKTCGILKNMGIKPAVTEIKAGTDANNFQKLGIESLIIATGRKDNHTTKESTTAKNLEKITHIAVSLITAEA